MFVVRFPSSISIFVFCSSYLQPFSIYYALALSMHNDFSLQHKTNDNQRIDNQKQQKKYVEREEECKQKSKNTLEKCTQQTTIYNKSIKEKIKKKKKTKSRKKSSLRCIWTMKNHKCVENCIRRYRVYSILDYSLLHEFNALYICLRFQICYG